MFKVANQLLHRDKQQSLPSHSDPKQLADEFATYFGEKIRKIRDSFPSDLKEEIEKTGDDTHIPQFDTLPSISDEDLRKIIMSSKTKSCALDPIPTTLLKQCLNPLLPVIKKIINLSFSSCKFPDSLKLAIILPLLKKIILDFENKKNYRPVSNLPFLGKLLEKSAVVSFSHHIKDNNLDQLLQSAYKEFHCVETALLVVFDDVLHAIDDRKHILMALLDYSAAFDTIDHGILFNRLHHDYGLSGSALEWLRSYFTGRHQAVSIGGSLSEMHELEFGIPQGSIFGPFTYPRYSAPIANIAESHGILYHLYADDTQLYIPCDSSNVDTNLQKLKLCIEDIKSWSTENKLKLNETKTEFLVIGSKFSRDRIPVDCIEIDGSVVQSVSSARNIGAIMDDQLQMVEHVSSVTKSAYFHLRNIAQIRRFLTQDATATLIHSLVTSRLDNLNSLLYGLPDTVIGKLQRIQNHAVKILFRKKKYDHVSPLLMSAHWLPVAYRIEFKLLVITHKCLHGKAPQYLSSRLEYYTPTRALRSSQKFLLVEKRTNLKSYGERAFSVAAPKLWNSLPYDLRACDSLDTFKAKLKTFLFRKAFG